MKLSFQHIQQHFDKHLPFVFYRVPNAYKVHAFLQQDQKCHGVTDYTEKGFVFAPFQADEKRRTVLFPIAECELLDFDFQPELVDLKPVKNEEDSLISKEYHDLIERAISNIQQHQFDKVVLSQKISLSSQHLKALDIFRRMLKKYPSAFVYCWYHPSVGLWLGATPEILATIDGNTLRTVALAGTQKFNGTLDVTWGAKELNEQQIVTDYIVSQLNELKIKSEDIKVSDVKTIQAGNLLHLKTEISAQFNRDHFKIKELLKTLHPTPAVCGSPKEQALAFILENEGYQRDYYSGFLGELNMTTTVNRNANRRNTENNAYKSLRTYSKLFVNLRCFQIENNVAHLYVGGGITKNSNPDQEWLELMAKLQTVKSVL